MIRACSTHGEERNKSVAQLKSLGKRVTNQNLIDEEMKRAVSSGNAYYSYCSVKKLLS
jgi:hypothetical protein